MKRLASFHAAQAERYPELNGLGSVAYGDELPVFAIEGVFKRQSALGESPETELKSALSLPFAQRLVLSSSERAYRKVKPSRKRIPLCSSK